MDKLDLEWIRANTISHDDFLNERLQDPEFQKEWIKQTILEYAEDGDYQEFYRALEQVIKARGSVSKFAEEVGLNRANLVDLLHTKTKTARSLNTVLKILDGLGYSFSISEKQSA